MVQSDTTLAARQPRNAPNRRRPSDEFQLCVFTMPIFTWPRQQDTPNAKHGGGWSTPAESRLCACRIRLRAGAVSGVKRAARLFRQVVARRHRAGQCPSLLFLVVSLESNYVFILLFWPGSSFFSFIRRFAVRLLSSATTDPSCSQHFHWGRRYPKGLSRSTKGCSSIRSLNHTI